MSMKQNEPAASGCKHPRMIKAWQRNNINDWCPDCGWFPEPAASDSCRTCKFFGTPASRELGMLMGRCNNIESSFFGDELHRNDGCNKYRRENEPADPAKLPEIEALLDAYETVIDQRRSSGFITDEHRRIARSALLDAINRYGDERYGAGKAWQALEQLKEKAGVFRPSAEAIRQAFYGDNDD